MSTLDPTTDALQAPPLAALFLIHFDLKVGYTIAWKRSISDVKLDGAVEFKSLPSGLHNIKEDLVYFIHGEYAGLSAFINRPASEAERNAHLVAVGVLVPLSFGRLGRGWLHAEELQELAKQLSPDITRTKPLEEFWEQYQLRDGHILSEADSALPSPLLDKKQRLNGHAEQQRHSDVQLPSLHPARSILKCIDTFGPLLFPLHRAALLRKRILFLTPAPVRLACEFVFDVSLLSSIPSSSQEFLPESPEEVDRLRPMFTIGIHDIPELEEIAKASAPAAGFIGCTTDDILAQKSKLIDIIIELRDDQHPRRRWPKMRTSSGTEIKATQRDLRRYKTLSRALKRINSGPTEAYTDDDEEATLLGRSASNVSVGNDADENMDDIVEPTSWSALAYNGFMWWASAGERDAAMEQEREADRELLSDLESLASPNSPTPYRDEDDASEDSEESPRGGIEMAVIAYFHRLTSSLLLSLSETVQDPEVYEDRNTDDANSQVIINSEDLRKMGLDGWSEEDKIFAKEMVGLYWKREAQIERNGIECCGVRIC